MKKIILLIGFIYFNSISSKTYEFFEMDVQKLLNESRQYSNEKHDYSKLIDTYKVFNETFNKEGITLIKTIFTKANESKYNLKSEDNIPNFVQFVPLCSKNVIDRANVENNSLNSDNFAEMASILNCSSILNVFTLELFRFIEENSDFIKKIKLYDQIYTIYSNILELSYSSNLTGMGFLGYFQLNTNSP